MSTSGNEILEIKSVADSQTLNLYQRLINNLLSQNDLDFGHSFSKIRIIPEPDCPKLPLFSGKLHAGYPSPAESYIESGLKPTEYLIEDEDMSYLRVIEGLSLDLEGIVPGTIVVIYYGIDASVGDIVFAEYNGDETIKILGRTPEGNPQLIPHSTKPFPTITITEFDDFRIVGVIDSWFMRRRNKRA